MTTDIYPSVLRLKGKKLPPTEKPEQAIGFLLSGNFLFKDFDFLNITEDALPAEVKEAWGWSEAAGRRYELFCWLGCVGRGWLLPCAEDLETPSELTDLFVDRMDESCTHEKSFEKTYHFDNGPRTYLLPLAFLRDFNYDQLIPAIRKVEYEGRAAYLERFAFYEGKTFRDVFPEEWFQFLPWTEQNNWDYLLYQFVD